MNLDRVVPKVSTLIHPVMFSNIEVRELARRERLAYIKELQTPIPHNSSFEKAELMKMREHKWMRDVDMTLVNPNEQSLKEFLVYLLDNADQVCDEVNLKSPLPLVSLDLETIGLSNRIRVEGGEILHNNAIVGICIGITVQGNEQGYYIPVNHYATEEVPNYSESEAFHFLEELNKKAFTVLHNARFDREIMSIHKIRLTYNYCDTMLLAIAVGLRPETKVSVGLKELAKQELDREMVELQQIMGVKDYIPLCRFEAKTITVYGCSDASNTLALFNLFVKSDKYANPFKTQKKAMIIDQKASDASRSMLRFGLPTDETAAQALLKTCIRRTLVLEEKFLEAVNQNIAIGSSEQVGTWIGTTICREFEKNFIKSDTSSAKRDELLAKFNKKLATDFGLEVKVKETKAGIKVVYNSPDKVLTNMQLLDDKYDWFPTDVAEQIANVCELVSDYRTSQHDYGIVLKFARYAKSDDYGICRTGIDLRYLGTITTRYSNGKGKGDFDTVSVNESKKGYKVTYSKGNGVAGYNAQGISGVGYKLIKAKKIVRIPDGIKNEVHRLNAETEELYRDMINNA